MGVDILPSELPSDSSIHFGNAVSEILEEFCLGIDETGVDFSKLSPRLVCTPHLTCLGNEEPALFLIFTSLLFILTLFQDERVRHNF